MEELKNPDIVDHNYVKKRIAKLRALTSHASAVIVEVLFMLAMQRMWSTSSLAGKKFSSVKNAWKSAKRCGRREVEYYMKKSVRINTIMGLVESIASSLKIWESVEAEGDIPVLGNTIDQKDSKNSIKNRCVVARAELMEIIRDLEG